SLVELMGGIVEVRASHGNTRLGGDDFDLRLAEIVADRFEEQHDIDLRKDRRAWARLLRAGEMAKIELSSHPFAQVKEEYIAEKEGVPLHIEHEINRREFEQTIGDLLDQTIDSIKRVLKDAEATTDEISQVLLVGGSTRIPAVWELVANQVGLEPHMSINPEEAVALGAGVQAAIIDGKPIDAILVDVTPYSLGIEVVEFLMGRMLSDRYSILIRRNTTIPVTKEEIYSTVHPDQETVRIKVYQGESPIASQNTLLDEFLITDLEPEHPGESADITVRFDFDVNGILKVTAQDRHTGQQKDIEVEATMTRLSETEIIEAQERMLEATMIAEGVALDAETIALMNQARQLLEDDDLAPEDRAELEEIVDDIQTAQAAGEAALVEELEEDLLDVLFDLEADDE
ncbi:MAG: Hsp70 family protein, partial [Chloroflexota bacterium]|nr:Hsp70 family protein [Chloroflexota bacterium]